MSNAVRKRVHVIACGVLSLDLKKLADESNIDMSMEFLPGGLHETPKKLKEELQKKIDVASKNKVADIIAIGYGICGRGTVGIYARDIPLAIPRVHDCISLFLGSDAEYRKQFAACPGTYYVSAGWVSEKVTPQEHCRTCRVTPEDSISFEALVEQYGQENAEDIEYFFSSWQRNYQRAAFIDTGVEHKCERYIELAKKMAEDFGWEYERLSGTDHLLRELLHQRSTTDEILIVQPNHMTVWNALGKGLSACAVWESGEGEECSQMFLTRAGVEISEEEFIKSEENKPLDIKLGLGIDAGGTYTDIVLFDFDQEKVVAKAKAATTKWDFTIGINEAVKKLNLANPEAIDLVTLSTTLATNSIVEGKGQKVGLLIMPPFGLFSPKDIDYSPLCVIDGRLDITGKEVSPINKEQVVDVARDMMEGHGVKAFAVTGFASINNHQHELQVKKILKEEFGCSVTCGHEISVDLNYRTRSITSALNARIIPCLEKLLTEMSFSLERQGILAPPMVVRSDGSLMNVSTALERPIETILSGPAASAKGAGFLANLGDALVVDIGGTTTDTAILENGRVLINNDGASVGGYRTHIKTLDLRTIGLGGDSNIRFVDRQIKVGPERILPACRQVAAYPETIRAIEWLARRRDKFETDTSGMEIVALTDCKIEISEHWSEKEKEIIEILRAGPMSLAQLCEKTDTFAPTYLPIHELENLYHIQRSGLTPTDLLHVLGIVDFWDVEASQLLCEMFAGFAGVSVEVFAQDALLKIRKLLAVEMIKRELASEVDVEEFEKTPIAQLLLENLFAGGNTNYKTSFTLQHPIIGIGAPTKDLLIPANDWLGTECITPLHGEVANAVGAIISSVHIQKILRIEPEQNGSFVLQGILGSPVYRDFEKAHQRAIEELRALVVESAAASGTVADNIKISWIDKVSTIANDSTIFIARIFTGEVSGMPSIQR